MMFNKLSSLPMINKLKNKTINYQHKMHEDIPFDVIKRGPLLLLFIGLPFAFLSFVFEIIFFYSWHKNLFKKIITN